MLFDLSFVPTLETERLRLRPLQAEDEQAYIAMLLDDEVSRFVFGPYDRSGAWRSFAAAIGHWALKGFGQFAVQERSGRTFVGRVALLDPAGWLALELAWPLTRAAWVKRYAVEGASAVRDHAFATLRPDRLISL